VNSQTEKLKQLIEDSQRILITSHVSPDPDAVSSVLLLGTTLSLNFPDKKAHMILEEQPDGLDFLESFEQIKFLPLSKALDDLKPDLFVMVDVANFGRASRNDGSLIKKYIDDNGVKTVTIDHHEPTGRDEVELYINTRAAAAVQEVYKLCFDEMNLRKPGGYAQATMLGLYADTGGFIYIGPENSYSLDLVQELVNNGVSIEDIKNLIITYTDSQMEVISELAANSTSSGDYTYSFMTDSFVDRWLVVNKSIPSLHRATKAFIDNYIRSIGGRKWGFIVYKDILEGEGTYSVSFRSLRFTKDVEKLAASLDGGGHKSAAGAKLQAKNIEEAISTLKDIIAESD
jgi:phosphoesterase RecJ-like protein